jgi:toxin-antitoxin system PIN domain toxin
LILPDVNVLLYAFRKDAPAHGAHRRWLEDVVNGDSAYGMSPQVLSSVVRVSTHPRIYAKPSTLREALTFASVLLDQPNCSVVQPGASHWSIFQSLCVGADVSGNLVQDAWLAALAIESGCEWITTDRDFARFSGLSWRPPF